MSLEARDDGAIASEHDLAITICIKHAEIDLDIFAELTGNAADVTAHGFTASRFHSR